MIENELFETFMTTYCPTLEGAHPKRVTPQTPKGRTQDPFKASRFAVIQGPLTAEIAVLYAKCAPFAPLSALTTSALDALWGQSTQMQGYTAHSIKRGAVKHLLPLLTNGKLSPHLIDRLTKHEEEGGPGTL